MGQKGDEGPTGQAGQRGVPGKKVSDLILRLHHYDVISNK